MSYEFKLPDLGEGLTEGEVARWLVTEGQEIAEDDPLVEIATDKTTVEIPSPAGGMVSKILVGEGEVVPVGTVLVVIGGDGSPGPAPVAQEKARATPLVRRLAQQLGVDLDAVIGTGPQGRITEQDVRNAAGPKEGRREPIRGVKRQMFEHLTKAHAVPTITWVEECDFTGVDLKVLVPLVLKTCAAALKEFPELNARVEDGELVYLDRYDIGVAMQTEHGLRRPGGARLRLALARRARRRRAAPRRRGLRRHARSGGSARRHVHGHERRPLGRSPSRRRSSTIRRSRSSGSTASTTARSCATARSPSAGWATSR